MHDLEKLCINVLFYLFQSDHIVDIKCSNLYVNGLPSLVTLDYVMDMSVIANDKDTKQRFKWDPTNR